MSDYGFVDRIRIRVFVVQLPGMTRERERFLIRNCRRLADTAGAVGVPLGVAWGLIGQLIERVILRMRTEQERETFVAIMQRVKAELFQECGCVSR
jgi:hypothetical protein